jgi:hydrogen peroxide-dependent heme synthase
MTGPRKKQSLAHAPATLEGWYSLHDAFTLAGVEGRREAMLQRTAAAAAAQTRELDGRGWSAVVSLVGGPADLLAIHFRESASELESARWALMDTLPGAQRIWSHLGVTEAGLYSITARAAAAAEARGGQVGDAEYEQEIARRSAEERESQHVQRRLYPNRPAEMPFVSFYPMSKRRDRKQNWYRLSLEERAALMHGHGMTGRRYAGRVLQIITGSIGLSEWEWGVTLFARDLLEVKRLVTDMRFDEVSARYAEFGDFHVGRVVEP